MAWVVSPLISNMLGVRIRLHLRHVIAWAMVHLGLGHEHAMSYLLLCLAMSCDSPLTPSWTCPTSSKDRSKVCHGPNYDSLHCLDLIVTMSRYGLIPLTLKFRYTSLVYSHSKRLTWSNFLPSIINLDAVELFPYEEYNFKLVIHLKISNDCLTKTFMICNLKSLIATHSICILKCF